MNARFHIIGCAVAGEPAAQPIEEFVEWARRFGAEILSQDDRQVLCVQFDAGGSQLIMHGCRAAAARRQPQLRFGFSSGVKEASGAEGQARVGERGIQQARDLAAAARPGQVLLSSQLGSLLQLSQLEPHERLQSTRVLLPDGRPASAYVVEPRRTRLAADRPPA